MNEFEPWSGAWYNFANPNFVIFVYLITPTFIWYVILGPETPQNYPYIRPKCRYSQNHIPICVSSSRDHVRDIFLPILQKTSISYAHMWQLERCSVRDIILPIPILWLSYAINLHFTWYAILGPKTLRSVQISVLSAEILNIIYPNVLFRTAITCVIYWC